MANRKRANEIRIRMNDDEYGIYLDRLQRSGMTGNDFGIDCLLDHPINVIENMPELIRQLKGIGNNLNQLTRVSNSGNLAPSMVMVKNEVAEGVNAVWQWLRRAKEEGY